MKELRHQLRQRRKSINKLSRKTTGKKILYQCQKYDLFRNAKHIAIFTPNDGEVETEEIINFLKNQGCSVYLPILSREKLKFAKLGKHFRKNRFGINEPINTSLLDAQKMDIIFMPLVGFDKYKNRLGMGGGFYDKTLEFQKNHNIQNLLKLYGLAFDCQEVDKLDARSWDVPVDGIVTPTRFLR